MPKMKPFNLELSPALRQALEDCHDKTGLSRGLILRYALTYHHAMTIARVPTCANGQACFCPHMHAALNAPPVLSPAAPQGQRVPIFPDPPEPLTPTKAA